MAKKHHVILSSADYVSRFEGNLDFGRFGWHVTWQDVNNDGLSDLILGSPYQTENVYNPTGGKNVATIIAKVFIILFDQPR